MHARRYLRLAPRLMLALSLGISVFAAVPAFALPDQGGYAGSNIDAAIIVNGTNMDIAGIRNNNVLNWQSFNIQSNEAVNFDSKNYLNLINGSSISQIYGTLNGKGNIYLINPNGVIFGRDCSINVGNLYVSTRVMDQEGIDAFKNGGSPLAGAFKYDPGSIIEIVNTQNTLKADKLTLEGGKIILENENANIEKLDVTKNGTPINLQRNQEEAVAVAQEVMAKEKFLQSGTAIMRAQEIYEQEYYLDVTIKNVKSAITEVMTKLGECIVESQQKEDLKALGETILGLNDKELIYLYKDIMQPIQRKYGSEFDSQMLEEIIKQVKEFEAERAAIQITSVVEDAVEKTRNTANREGFSIGEETEEQVAKPKVDELKEKLANRTLLVKSKAGDKYYQTLREDDQDGTPDQQYPAAKQIGIGTMPAATQRIFAQGALQTTENPTDLAIQGEGFFRITMPDGSTAYTRNGNFKLDANGRLVTSEGYPLADNITFAGATPEQSVVIAENGTVSQTPQGGSPETIGNITIARFINPAGLISIGKNLFVVSEASGDPITCMPGTNGVGVLTQNALEMSTVPIVEEMINQIASQRAYDSNLRTTVTPDAMLEIASSLKR